MKPQAIRIADAVVAAIYRGPLGDAVVERRYIPRRDLDEIDTTYVDVVPFPSERERESRDSWLGSLRVGVIVRRRCDGQAEEDAILELWEQQVDRFGLDGFADIKWAEFLGVETTEIDGEHLANFGVMNVKGVLVFRATVERTE